MGYVLLESILLQLVMSDVRRFRLACTLSQMIRYKTISRVEFQTISQSFPSEREGYGSRLFSDGLDDDLSISWSNIKLEEHDLLPSS
jgi:hypothetical protein